MRREEISRLNLGNSIDKLSNIDPRGYGVCNILYKGAREYTGYPLTMNSAEKLVDKLSKNSLVYIITGFILPTHKKAEMDGIVSSMLLARALVKAFDAKPVIICPEENIPAVRNLSVVMGLHLFENIDEIFNQSISMGVVVSPKEKKSATALADKLCECYLPDAVISVEAPAANNYGVYHNAIGKDVSALEAKSDIIFEKLRQKGVLNIAVGDLGNEIGMASIRKYIQKYVPYAGNNQCVCGCNGGISGKTEADNIITATVSDWGCVGMIACVAYILGDIDIMPDENLMRETIITASRSGMIDMTGWVIPAVDGVDCEVNVHILSLMRDVVQSTLKYKNTGDNWYEGVEQLGFFRQEMKLVNEESAHC